MALPKPPECPYCHRLIGFQERHRRFCAACGQELPRAHLDPRLRHAAQEGDRRRQHGEKP
jgi:predicted amidophosphoribosyltransferase